MSPAKLTTAFLRVSCCNTTCIVRLVDGEIKTNLKHPLQNYRFFFLLYNITYLISILSLSVGEKPNQTKLLQTRAASSHFRKCMVSQRSVQDGTSLSGWDYLLTEAISPMRKVNQKCANMVIVVYEYTDSKT